MMDRRKFGDFNSVESCRVAHRTVNMQVFLVTDLGNNCVLKKITLP